MNDQIIIIFGFMALIGIISVIALSGVISTDVGCHIICPSAIVIRGVYSKIGTTIDRRYIQIMILIRS
jgi:hypothetical protein